MIDLLEKAAKEAGDVLLHYFKKNISVSEKASHQNLVTEADIASQNKIQDILLKGMLKKGYSQDDIGFIGEEGLYLPRQHTFIIDPLDGTNNFASSFDYFGLAIAYVKDNQLLTGVIYRPSTSTFYIAEKNHSAWKIRGNKKEKLTMAYTPLKDSLLSIYLSSNKERRDRLLHLRACSESLN